jgi:hypothetical protein
VSLAYHFTYNYYLLCHILFFAKATIAILEQWIHCP